MKNILVVSLFVFSLPLIAQDPGDVHFDYRFGIPGTSYYQSRMCVDPRNGDVYVGGDQFTHAGTVEAKNIAKWVRSTGRWEALGAGIVGGNPSPEVKAWVVDPRNGDLYVAGGFTTAGTVSANGLAKWNGTAWSAISGNNYQGISGMTINPSTGELYVTYASTSIAGVTAANIARWNGTAWSPLGAGISAAAKVIIFDAASNSLIVGGNFNTLDGKMIRGLAKWNGTSWDSIGFSFLNASANGSGMVYSLALDGSTLYAGCDFAKVGGKSIQNIAKWNGSSWSAVDSLLDAAVTNVVVVNGAVYATGVHRKSAPSNVVMSNLAKLTNGQWEAIGLIAGGASAAIAQLASYQNDVIAVGAQISGFGNVPAKNIGRYVTTTKEWLALNSSSTLGIDVGTGVFAKSNGNIYMGGASTIPGSPGIMRWTGAGWAPVGRGLYYALSSYGTVSAITASPNGDLYVGGSISYGLNPDSSKVTANGIIKWNASTTRWEALGTGTADKTIYDLKYYNGKLYMGGSFTLSSNTNIKNLAVWNGAKWDSVTSVGGAVRNIAFAPNGEIVVGGDFTSLALNSSLKYLGKWNGTQWDAIGGAPSARVNKLCYKGNDLYIGGAFTNIGGKALNALSKWNGTQWDTVSSAITTVYDFVFQGDTLFVSGVIAGLGYQFNAGVGYFINSNWTKLGSGFNNITQGGTISVAPPSSMFVDGSDVWLSGYFNLAGNRPMLNVARWNSFKTISATNKMDGNIPGSFTLEQNYPNPFNPSTTIEYQIPNSGFVSLKVYDILGREAAALLDDCIDAGSYKVIFDGKGLSSGVYFYRMQSGHFVATRKLLLTK